MTAWECPHCMGMNDDNGREKQNCGACGRDRDDQPPAMQARCVHCLREQYAIAVLEASLGLAGCTWCGKKSELMTRDEYRAALAAARVKRDGLPGGPL